MTHCHESHNKMSQVTESLNLSKKNADNKEKFRSISKYSPFEFNSLLLFILILFLQICVWT